MTGIQFLLVSKNVVPVAISNMIFAFYHNLGKPEPKGFVLTITNKLDLMH